MNKGLTQEEFREAISFFAAAIVFIYLFCAVGALLMDLYKLSDTDKANDLMEQAISRGYGEYCEGSDLFAWVGECEGQRRAKNNRFIRN